MTFITLCLQEGSSSGGRLLSLERTRSELSKAAKRITELEETLHGKQAALDSLVTENESLRSTAAASSSETASLVDSIETADNKQVSLLP